MKIKLLATAVAMAVSLLAAGQAQAQEKLTVWWGKGFYKAEDDALFAAIKKFEAKNPTIKIDLSLYAPQEMVPKSVAALDAGNPPDVSYGDVYDFQVTAKWAYDGNLKTSAASLIRCAPSLNRPHFLPPFCSTTPHKSGPTTPSRSSSKPCISSTGKTC